MARPRRITPLDDAPQAASLSLVPPGPEPEVAARTPARQKLADAIETVRALEAEIVETSAAVSKAERDLSIARGALSDAENAMERAKPRPISGFIRQQYTFRSEEEAEAYQAELNKPPVPIEDARAAVAKATDAKDSAEAARQFHEGLLDQLTQRLRWKRSDIDAAARLAVHFDPATAALAAETKRLVTQAAAAVRAFEMATNNELLQFDHPYQGSTKPTDFRTDPQGWALLHRWRETLEQLRTDPDAVLPL